ncbi:hypothetical protein LPJ64_001602 [Coemansia asiatica]|uniref:Uncharacterized protein n=1 Tax=Coemansia asiatica TaxID=1052880 RepID=A0A9W7XQB4_9FUNG|nr:hypothetical protein LPJ64_001602 [Coemansia asiatica]KAJ2880525.1 hypothetical protein FB639_002811 [Coemansia asiatica]
MDRVHNDQLFAACDLYQLGHLYIDYSFTRSQLNSAYSRYIDNSPAAEYEEKIIDILASTSAFAYIQKLDFQMYNITFNDIVRILANVPCLYVFGVCPVRDQPSIDGLQGDYLIQCVQSDIFPLSKVLTRIFIYNGPALYVEKTCQSLALLVAGCPRLSVLDSTSNYRLQLVEGFKKLMEDKSFKPYHERIEMLFTEIN